LWWYGIEKILKKPLVVGGVLALTLAIGIALLCGKKTLITFRVLLGQAALVF
jgi:hypothetical protein